MVLCFIPRDPHDDTTNGRPEKSILDRKSPFSLYWIAIFTTNLVPRSRNLTQKTSQEGLGLHLEGHRLLFDGLVLQEDRGVRGRYFSGLIRRRNGSGERSLAES